MPSQDAASSLSLVVRRFIAAPQDAVFAAWTEPAHLLKWWGPRGVTLAAAEIDLRVGGRYRLANQYEDGSVLWITGVFEVIDRPRRITYTWAHEPADDSTNETTRVTVRFVHRDQGTEVIVAHHGIRSARSRRSHRAGWAECLDGLAIVGPAVLRASEERGGPLSRSAPATRL
jgi:uncharacterized protein YndB with AHSA1/START domain